MVASKPKSYSQTNVFTENPPSDNIEARVLDLAVELFDASVVLLRLPNAENRYRSMLASPDCNARAVASTLAEKVAAADKIVIWSADSAADGDPSFVSDDGPVQFFAGIPISLPDAACLGVLCVLDGSPRTISDALRERLAQLRDMVIQNRQLQRERAAREEAEARYRRVQTEYRTVFENAQDALFLVDVQEPGPTFRVLQLNDAHESITGLSTQDVRGQTPQEILGETEGQRVEARYCECVEARDVIKYEETLSFPEGETTWQTTLTPVIVDGRVTHLVGDAREISRQKKIRRQLEESNRRLRLALESADAGTFLFDVAAEEVEWDERTIDIYGLDGEARRVEASQLYELVHPDDKSRLANVFYGALETEESYQVTYRIVRPDGDERTVHSNGIVVRNEAGTAERVVGINRDVTERRRLEREVLSISEMERRRIGQHLHDTLGGHLSGARMLAQNFEQDIADGKDLSTSTAHRLVELVKEAEEQVRQLSHSLIPMEGPDQSLPVALQRLCSQRDRMGAVRCEAEIDDGVSGLHSEVKTHLYRIASEAVTNAAKHADPDTICVGLHRTEDALVLRVRDDGIGLSDENGQSEGAGLRIMRHRASWLGASLDIEELDGEGTEVRCTLSLSKMHHEPDDRAFPGAEVGG